MSDRRPIALSDDHVAQVTLVEDAPLHKPEWRMLEDADLDALTERLTRDCPRPIPIFAYGSLIWNPGFVVGGRRRATAIGLTFYADPVDTDTAALAIGEQAMRLAHASGPAGSGAEYLLRTAQGLDAHGIHDPYIWQLQELVAAEIEGWPA